MMDRNTIIAFILIALIFIVWQMVWVNNAPTPVPQTAAPVDSLVADSIAKVRVVVPVVDSSALALAADTSAARIDSIPEVLIDVETDHYRARLSNKGGGIVSLKLKNYRYADSGNVNLLPSGSLATPTVMSSVNNFTDNGLTYFADDTASISITGGSIKSIRFETVIPGKGGIIKEFVFHGDKYSFDVNLTINGARQLGLEREYAFAWLPPIPPTETNLQDDFSSYKGGVYLSGEMYKIEKFGDDNRLKDDPSGNAQWAGSRTKYFGYAIIPTNVLSSGATFRGERTYETTAAGKHERRAISAGVVIPVGSAENMSNQFTIFAGPLDYRLLKGYNANLEDFIDWGWQIIRPFSFAVYWLAYQLHRMIPNYGFVIILVAILMKLVTYPLTKKSLNSMQAMKRVQPKMEELKAKYKSDPTKLNQAMMKLYKDEGVNPFSGCILLLPQMPLMFGLYQVFRSTIEFRQAYFLSYWPDLSLPDPFPYVMPILMTIAMFFQQKMSMTDPKQKMLVYLMPAVFFFMMKSLPIGLVLYWTAFSVLSIAETVMIRRGQQQLNPQVR
jgi:YidC/Oxa1 family membrane protein insertase